MGRGNSGERVFAWGGSEGEKVGEDLRPGMDVKCAKVNGIITNTTLRMRMRKSQHHLRNVLVFFLFYLQIYHICW